MRASIGAVLALLFAPKSGQELRGDIAVATRKGIDRTRETASQVGARAGEKKRDDEQLHFTKHIQSPVASFSAARAALRRARMSPQP